ISVSSTNRNISKDLPIFNNSKVSHANLLHTRWSSNYKKDIFSNRTGISYQASYSAYSLDHILPIRIEHLLYKIARSTPWKKDYNFLLPRDALIPTVKNFSPRPNMFIPVKYQDIIPPHPIYSTDDVFIAPGSHQWFTYMDDLLKQRRIEAAKIAKSQAKKEQTQLKAQHIFKHGSTKKHYE
ncbi:404_t:CDS:2, partial [Rhizophagus irregularis]